MSTTAYTRFQLRHRIDLKAYLEKFEGRTFTKKNDHWVSQQQPVVTIFTTGLRENCWQLQQNGRTETGDIVDWERLQHQRTIMEAYVAVNQRKKHMGPYTTQYFRQLNKVFNHTALHFEISLKNHPAVCQYLQDRGIQWKQFTQEFHLGAVTSFELLRQSFQHFPISSKILRHSLKDIGIARQVRGKRVLPWTEAVVVPVSDRAGNWIGFHGRKTQGNQSYTYFHSGYVSDRQKHILYGEAKDHIRQAIQSKHQVILTKGLFDFLTTYQAGYTQVFATLNQGISVQQFDRVVDLPVEEIIVGFESPKERQKMLGLRKTNLQQLRIKVPQTDLDIDASVQQKGLSVQELVRQAREQHVVNKHAQRQAAIQRRDAQMDTLAEFGGTFLVPTGAILQEVSQSKGRHSWLRQFVRKWADENRQQCNNKYVRFSQTFLKNLDKFQSELRTHLFLLAKCGQANMVRFKTETLQAELDLAERQMHIHLRRLEKSRFLLRVRKIKGKGKTRRDHFEYYPSTIRLQISHKELESQA